MNKNDIGCFGLLISLFLVGLIWWGLAWVVASILCQAIPSIIMSNKIVFLIWVILILVAN